MAATPDVIVAGHICLDLIPTLPDMGKDSKKVFRPGTLVEVGKAVTAIGGVANTGLALCRLGIQTRLVSKVGDDLWGNAICGLLQDLDEILGEGVVRSSGIGTSYTVVLSPPGLDRMFLHSPGANETFGMDDIDFEKLKGAKLFHFGYPTILKKMYENGPDEAREIFKRVKGLGLLTSMDMTLPDPVATGMVDWKAWLSETLPFVDLFFPSVDELLYMLDRKRYEALKKDGGGIAWNGALLRELSGELIEMGVAVAVIKLGDHGLYLRTSDDMQRFSKLESSTLKANEDWREVEMYTPCFCVSVTGTTGAGDSTIAGFLAAIVKGMGPDRSLELATAVGACSVEKSDATSGVPMLATVQARMKSGWLKADPSDFVKESGWEQREAFWTGSKGS